ncbi:hypothetical protein WPS_02150 [Vulcanimicrobium alpinum]|uniref:DUF1232 domain-containing protein n=1 Tax=Vulcanimicrobium alpinum TaxID=3016050 RepID=A0AAN1XSI5_UNVUL|nr:hypothetical protein [Vulcanimicrobium alpinum]BDE04939.1 hypothetical protein WPS_02150 [Vulcanimicrobium alpinum]
MALIRFLVTSRTTLTRAYTLARDARVPLRLKLLALAGALLILSPLNILGDIPLLGIVDDAALLGLLAAWFVRQAARAIEVPVYAAETSRQTLMASR